MQRDYPLLSELPYGQHFLFVDGYEFEESSSQLRTWKQYLESDPIVEAHFQDGPRVVPGVILVEQLCQSALLLGMICGMVGKTEKPLLGEIKASFKRQAIAPCRVEAHVEIDAALQAAFGFVGSLYDNDIELCRVKGFCVTSTSNRSE